MKIIFLCHGNICRSPMAEFVMKDMLERRGIRGVEISSRAARTDEIGSDMYPPARRTLDAHGVPYTKRAARLITRSDFDLADAVVVMDDENVRDMRRAFGDSPKVVRLMSYVGSTADVADPWYTRDFERTYSDIVRGCSALADRLEKGLSPLL